MKMISGMIAAATGAGFTLVPVPADMTVLGFDVTPSTATGCASTVSLKSGSTTLGSAAVLTATAKADIINGAMSTTLATRKTLVTKTVPLEVAVDARTNSSAIFFTVYLDEFALQRD